jgi:hypothetical protein
VIATSAQIESGPCARITGRPNYLPSYDIEISDELAEIDPDLATGYSVGRTRNMISAVSLGLRARSAHSIIPSHGHIGKTEQPISGLDGETRSSLA